MLGLSTRYVKILICNAVLCAFYIEFSTYKHHIPEADAI